METIVAATIGAAGLVGSTWLGQRKTAKAVKEVQRSVGTPNGKGDITTMLERLIEWRGEHMRDHQHLDEMFGPSK